MRSLFPSIIIAFALTSCVSTGPTRLEFKTTEEAETYLRKHKACPGCDLYQAELSFTDLQGADLRKANLKGSDLNSSDLRNANLRGANLTRADLSWKTKLEGADLSFADLTEANVSEDQLKLANTYCAKFPKGEREINCEAKEEK